MTLMHNVAIQDGIIRLFQVRDAEMDLAAEMATRAGANTMAPALVVRLVDTAAMEYFIAMLRQRVEVHLPAGQVGPCLGLSHT